MPPAAADVGGMEDSNAKETLQDFPPAVGAYDRMPFASAAAVWTLDTSTDIFLLHSLQVRHCQSVAIHPQPGPACFTASIHPLP